MCPFAENAPDHVRAIWGLITTKVKSALLGDDAVKSFAVSVETAKGVVQLSGFVNTSDQKSAAGKDASAVPGVKSVKNDLIVK